MKKRKLYIYNPETDNFERFYPTFKDRFKSFIILFLFSLVIGLGIFFYIFFGTPAPPTEENLRAQNTALREHYQKLDKQVSETMKVVEEIQKRGNNFYKIILQLDSGASEGNNVDLAMLSYQPVLNNYNDSRLLMSISEKLDVIEQQLVIQSKTYDEIKNISGNFKDKITHIPAVLPIHSSDYTVSSGYGPRIDPILEVTKFHEGLDFAAPMGTKVYATADGQVSFSGDKEGYGNCIDIDHGNSYTTRYGHLAKRLVESGKQVKRGELIGLVGSTGKSTGPHLHYEVRLNDEPQNPVNYYFLDITPTQYDELIRYAASAGHVMD